MNKCVIWDFDNTLAFRNGMWTKSLCNILDRNGKEYDAEKVRGEFKTGLPWNHPYKAHDEYFGGLSWWAFANLTVSRALEAAGLTGDENSRLTLLFRDEYLKKSEWHLYNDTIFALKTSKRLGNVNMILSNHTPELIDLVESLGISGYFESVTSSATAGYEKPDPRIFRAALSGMRLDACIMVGDNYEADIRGALDFGIDAVLVRKENRYGYGKYSPDLYGIEEFIK